MPGGGVHGESEVNGFIGNACGAALPGKPNSHALPAATGRPGIRRENARVGFVWCFRAVTHGPDRCDAPVATVSGELAVRPRPSSMSRRRARPGNPRTSDSEPNSIGIGGCVRFCGRLPSLMSSDRPVDCGMEAFTSGDWKRGRRSQVGMRHALPRSLRDVSARHRDRCRDARPCGGESEHDCQAGN